MPQGSDSLLKLIVQRGSLEIKEYQSVEYVGIPLSSLPAAQNKCIDCCVTRISPTFGPRRCPNCTVLRAPRYQAQVVMRCHDTHRRIRPRGASLVLGTTSVGEILGEQDWEEYGELMHRWRRSRTRPLQVIRPGLRYTLDEVYEDHLVLGLDEDIGTYGEMVWLIMGEYPAPEPPAGRQWFYDNHDNFADMMGSAEDENSTETADSSRVGSSTIMSTLQST